MITKEVIRVNEEKEVLMENVVPEDLPTEEEKKEKEFYPSPAWKRVLAWVLFGILLVGIILWLVGIAVPDWVDTVKAWLPV